jgi:ComF family protein
MRCCLALQSAAVCSDCAFHAPAFDRIIAGFDYLAPADMLIHYLKVQKQFTLAPLLAGLLAEAVRNAQPTLPHDAILVPVPASPASLVRRGFNPAAEIARCLAKELGLAYRPALLRRSHDGLKQAQLARLERVRSVKRLYACTQKLDGATIAVVDDVLTTGSTLNSIARELRSAGAASVYGLVLARTPWQR